MTERDKVKQLDQAKESADIINFKVNGAKIPNFRIARTEPNKRLKTVFGIDNAFTNPSPLAAIAFIRHATRTYVGNAVEPMKKTVGLGEKQPVEDWTALRNHALRFCKEYRDHPDNAQSINLASLVQLVTLKVSLYYLFPSEVNLTSDVFKDYVVMDDRINQLWINSKKDAAQRPNWEKETKLQDALRRVLTRPLAEASNNINTIQVHGWWSLASMYSILSNTLMSLKPVRYIRKLWTPTAALVHSSNDNKSMRPDPSDPPHNPMNLILPAYETMWRVVMRCFLEIQYRGANNRSEWCRTMKEYVEELADPHIARPILKSMSPTDARPMDIVKKGLRFILTEDKPNFFFPERWRKIEDDARKYGMDAKDWEERLCFMPFAFHCPSSQRKTNGFGYKMIALLVGVLCDTINEGWNLAGVQLPKLGTPLRSDRAHTRISN
ncbi:hypothetical protein CC86DRAFT_405951 [Ophiobolus disseminans]|uniref:Uncharacterized protein n=1 Tax=Ophiobolus disseminans TaxID=1469910 RepID=A0A6A7A1Q8_9PLEO|nr:hypothetical protein CC86DRAFT_405951 [Ophiobolus disseminans]